MHVFLVFRISLSTGQMTSRSATCLDVGSPQIRSTGKMGRGWKSMNLRTDHSISSMPNEEPVTKYLCTCISCICGVFVAMQRSHKLSKFAHSMAIFYKISLYQDIPVVILWCCSKHGKVRSGFPRFDR